MKGMFIGLVMLAGVALLPAMAGSLSGTVVERSSSLPVQGAVVTVHVLLPDSVAFPDTTDEAGFYRIEGIIPDNQIYVVMAGKPGFKGYYLRHDAIGTGSYSLDILLEPESIPPPGGGGDSSDVSGQVFGRDGLSGALSPVAGAEIRLASGAQTYVTQSDAKGEYRTVVPLGSYAITASATGYRPTGSTGVTVEQGGLTYGAILTSALTGVAEGFLEAARYRLIGAYPNPFNPATRIRYAVPGAASEAMVMKLVVFDLLGREVATLIHDRQVPGVHEIQFDAVGLPSGVYFCRLIAGGFAETKKLILKK